MSRHITGAGRQLRYLSSCPPLGTLWASSPKVTDVTSRPGQFSWSHLALRQILSKPKLAEECVVAPFPLHSLKHVLQLNRNARHGILPRCWENVANSEIVSSTLLGQKNRSNTVKHYFRVQRPGLKRGKSKYSKVTSHQNL